MKKLDPRQARILAQVAVGYHREELADHQLASLAARLSNEGISPSRLAQAIKRPRTYICNLARWWRRLPPEVRLAWTSGHPRLNHPTLDRLAQLGPEKAAVAWRSLQTETCHRRPSGHQLRQLLEKIQASDKLTSDQKLLASEVLHYALGDAAKALPTYLKD